MRELAKLMVDSLSIHEGSWTPRLLTDSRNSQARRADSRSGAKRTTRLAESLHDEKRFSAVHDGGIKPRLVTAALGINRALSNVRTVGVNEEVKESHWLLPTPGP